MPSSKTRDCYSDITGFRYGISFVRNPCHAPTMLMYGWGRLGRKGNHRTKAREADWKGLYLRPSFLGPGDY